MKKLLALMLLAVMTLSLTSSLAETDQYTPEEMIAWAIQDEVDAEAAYQTILNAFGEDLRPFSAIVKAERTHQALLQPLMEKYGIPTPQSTPIAAPATVMEAMLLGVEAEEKNIDMYKAFLAQEDLPDEVKAVFERLTSGSENHLDAFSRRASRLEGGRNNGSDEAQTFGRQPTGGNGRRTDDATTQNRNQRNRRSR